MACGNGFSNNAEHARTYEQRHPITVKHEEHHIEIPLEKNQTVITPIQKAKIKGFLYQYNESGKNNLVITVPESGMQVSAARMAVSNIVEIVQSVGIDEDNILIGTYKPLSEKVGSVRLSFEAVVAEASKCDNGWSKNLADAYNNELSENHGCATRNNLAAMIVRPEDLVQMPSMTPGHGERRVTVFDKYILGENTNAAKGETASATAQ